MTNADFKNLYQRKLFNSYMDIAASVQKVTEDIILDICKSEIEYKISK